jgi:tetratricopeptide (TPR) repeat protein
MIIKDKLKKVADLDEKSLREAVLLPLLSRMGVRAVTIYHGPRERGKDIVGFDLDHFGNREYIAVVAKTTDLDGSISSSSALREVLFQVEQCFDVPYEDLFGMRSITMDRVWVVTSGRIVPGAADSVFEGLRKRNLSKLVRFIDREQLIDMLDQHYGEYWGQSAETIDALREQKQRLVRFTRDLLLALGAKNAEVDEAVNAVLHSSTPPAITFPPDRSLTRLSPYRIEIDTIAEKYSHGFYSHSCGFIRDAFFEAKQSLYYAMFDVEEIMEHYEKVIKTDAPQQLLREFESNLSEDYPFWRASSGRADEALRNLEYLREGVQEVNQLCDKLRAQGKLKWALSLVDSVRALKPEIEEFLLHSDQEEFLLKWQIETKENRATLRLVHGKSDVPGNEMVETKHKRIVEFYQYRSKATRQITAKDVMNKIHQALRDHLDKLIASH